MIKIRYVKEEISEFEIHSHLFERLVKNPRITAEYIVRGEYEVVFEDYRTCIFDIVFISKATNTIQLVVEIKTKKPSKSSKQKRKYIECLSEERLFYVKGMDEVFLAEPKIERLLNV